MTLHPSSALLVIASVLIANNPALAAKDANTCEPRNGQVIVRFTYGSEKAAWIHEVTETFNQRQEKTASGKNICVNAIPMGSGDSVNAIRSGQAGPEEIHATSPASDLYVNLINHVASQANEGDLLKVEGFLVSSPVVIAAWDPVVASLGQAGDIGWGTVFKQATNSNFRYGQTNPERSNSGLTALVAQFYAGAEAVDGRPVARLSLSRVSDEEVRSFVSRVHDNVIHYGRSTGFYAKKMRDGGPNYADAVVIYESDVIQANAEIRSSGKPYPKLRAIYPGEGTFSANHPYAIVKREWVDVDEEEGAKRYFEYLSEPQIQAIALQYGFRPGVALDIDPKIYEVVWNEENGVAPFNTVHKFLAAPSGQVISAILDSFRTIKNDAQVVLVLDRSGSMDAKIYDKERGIERTRMEMAVESASLLAERLQPSDKLTLLLYDYDVTYSDLTPKGQPLRMDAEGKLQLANALEMIRPKGGTAMRSAILTAWKDMCETIKANPSNRSIRILVVLTDGVDNASRITTEGLIDRIGYNRPGKNSSAEDSVCKIPVFGVAFGQGADDTVLKSITAAAGGETRRGYSDEIREIFRRFSDLL